MNLSLSRSDDAPLDWPAAAALETLRRIYASNGPAGATLGVIVVGDEYIRDINARFRGKDTATDVISFSYLDDDSQEDDDLVGEVYISHETVARDARESGVDVSHLFLRLGVHGLLHVLGHDHESDDDAERMEDEERRILAEHLDAETVAGLFQAQ